MPAYTAPTGAPCWIDLLSTDPDRSTGFYGAVFGWAAGPAGEEPDGYVTFTLDGVPIAGMMRSDGSADMPDSWNTYFAVPDAKAAADAALDAGGHMHIEPSDLDGRAVMSMVGDPGGAALGLWQAGSFPGYGRHGEPGAPAWHELHTRDYAAVLEFYRTVLGCEPLSVGDTDEFRYSQLMTGELAYCGVMDARAHLAAGVPSTWQTYIAVADVDATLATAADLGAEVVDPAMDTPFGRLAGFCDPNGAFIKVITPPAG